MKSLRPLVHVHPALMFHKCIKGEVMAHYDYNKDESGDFKCSSLIPRFSTTISIPTEKFSKTLGYTQEHPINKSAEEKNPALPTIKEHTISIVDKDGIVIATFINMYFADKFLHCVKGEFKIKQ